MSAFDPLIALLTIIIVGVIYLVMIALTLGFVYLIIKTIKYAWLGVW